MNVTTRIGAIVPSVNTVIEGWYPYAVPPDVRLHTARMPIGRTVTPGSLRDMDSHGTGAARRLAACRPNVVVYGCTASSLAGGREYDLRLMRTLSEIVGAPALTATESVLRSLAHLRVTTVAVASPYTDDIGRTEVDFLGANGHPVLGSAHLGIGNGFELAAPSGHDIVEIARKAWQDARGAADALFLGCMNLNAHHVLACLEAELGVPVVSATSAGLWAALTETRHAVNIPGFGRLLAG